MKMLLRYVLVLLGFFFISNAQAQRAKDGSYTATGASEVLNTYTNLTVNANTGATTLTVANNSMTGGAFGGTPLQQGDLILIIQTQGCTVDINNFPVLAGWGSYTIPQSYFSLGPGMDPQTFGQITNEATMAAGRFERVEVQGTSGVNQITLTCGLTNNYIAAQHAQIVRIPRYDDLTVNNGAAIVPTLWNGTTGGIVALEVDGTLTVNTGGSISATGYGFRGGQLDNGSVPGIASTGGTGFDRFLGSPAATEGSEKGESIFGYHTEYDGLDSRYGIAPIANGGGGGGFVNAGGGGGSNAEVGAGAFNARGNPVPGYAAAYGQDPAITASSGGGQGGYALSQSNQNANFTGPNQAAWAGDGRKDCGGWGGHPLTYNANRIFFGGGGGAGDQDSGQGGAGGRGGGIVYIVNYGTVTGGGEIQASGEEGQNSNPTNQPLGANPFRGNDGAGGGGGGGTVYIENAAAIPNTIDINAVGGDGGDQNLQVNLFQLNEGGGPGGAGSGGIIRFSSGTPTQSVVSGTAGVTTSSDLTEFPPNGATNGSTGDANLPAPYYDLIPNDVTICAGQMASPSVTVQGSYSGTLNWYTVQYGGTPIVGQTNQLTYNVSPGTTTTYWVGVCPGTFRVPVVVTVTASPNLVITDPAAVCAPATVDITAPAVTAGSDAGTLTYWQDMAATMTQGTPTAVGAGTYYIQLDIGGGCTTVEPVTVTVNPLDDASFTSADYCESASNTIGGVVTPGGTFSIASQTGSGSVTINATTGVLSNGVAGDQVTIEYLTNGPCPNTSQVVVNVLADDDASFTSSDFCASSVNTISGVATLGGTFSIASQTGSGGVTINASTGILSNYIAGDQVTIQYTTGGACSATSTVLVNVTNLDDASFTSADFCEGSSNTISGVVTLGGTFTIASQTGSGGVTIDGSTGVLSNGVAGDQVTIEYTTGGVCSNSSQVVVNVLGLDDASFTSADYCIGGANTISGVATLGGAFTIASQTGSGSVTINGTTGILSGGAAGDQITIEYTTPAGGCQNSSTQVVNILPLDDATFVTNDFCASAVNIVSGIVTPGGTFGIASQTGSGGVTINASTGVLANYFAGDQVTIQYTTNGSCPNSSTVVVNVTNLDDASFTIADFCASAVNIVSGVATPGGTFNIVSQTGSGGVTINTTTGILANYFAGDQVTIEYTTPAGGCQNSSQVIVNVNAADDASFNYSAASYCIDGTDPMPTISGLAGGAFSSTAGLVINAGTGEIDLSASTPGTYTVTYTTAGACPNSSNVSVTVNDLPVITVVSPVNVCEPNDVILDATAPGAGFTFQFFDNVPTAIGSGTVVGNNSTLTIGVLAAGSYNYSATITDPTTGCSASAPIVVNVTALDDASFNYGTAAYCQEGTDPTPTVTGLAGGTFSSTAGLVINGGTGEIDLSASTAGTYTVTYQTNGTCPNSSTQSVTVNATPTISGATSVCPGATTTLTGSGTPDATTPWTSSSLGVATVDNAGVVTGVTAGTSTITYLDANGCTNNVVVTVTTAPVLDPLTPLVGCDSIQLPTIGGTGLTGNESYYTGVGGTGTVYAAGDWVSTSTTIYVNDLSNPCTVEQSTSITINVSPTISGGTAVCELSTLSLSGTGTPDPVTPWASSAPGVATVDNAGLVTGVAAGTADITYTDNNGCSNTITVTVNVTPTITGNAPICVGATNALTGSGTPDATTPWTSSDPAVATVDNAGVVTAVSAGTSTITYLNANGCSTTEVVTVNAAPNLVITDPAGVCIPATVDITDPAVTAGSDPGTLTYWTDNLATIALPTPNAVVATGTYYIQLDDGNCTSIQAVNVTVNPMPTIVLTDPTPVCDPSLVDLTDVAVTVGSDPGTFTYFDGMGTAIPDPTQVGSGIYFITLTDAIGCQSAGQVTATVNPTPNLVVIDPSPVCEPNLIDLTAAAVTAGSDAGTLTYWDDMTAATANATPTGVGQGTYYIQLEDANGCTSISAVNATVNPLDDATFTLTPTCDGATAQLLGTAGGTFSIVSASAGTIDPMTGTVTGAAYNDVIDIEYATTGICPNVAMETVVVNDCTPQELVVPTAFTPGGDGVHDTWEIVGLDNLYPNNRVLVYNRWGSKVFEHSSSSANPYSNNMWDGTFNGAELPVASYYYIIETNDPNSTEKYEGTVTILK